MVAKERHLISTRMYRMYRIIPYQERPPVIPRATYKMISWNCRCYLCSRSSCGRSLLSCLFRQFFLSSPLFIRELFYIYLTYLNQLPVIYGLPTTLLKYTLWWAPDFPPAIAHSNSNGFVRGYLRASSTSLYLYMLTNQDQEAITALSQNAVKRVWWFCSVSFYRLTLTDQLKRWKVVVCKIARRQQAIPVQWNKMRQLFLFV